MAHAKALAAFLVILAVAVHSAEVQMLDDATRMATPNSQHPPENRPVEKARKVKVNREAFYRGDLDSDSAGLDNGDDTDLLETWEGAKKKRTHADLGEAADVTQGEMVNSANVVANKKEEKDVEISKTDEKFLPAIMDKLKQLHEKVATLKGANWEEILEKHRDGVVQIMVVKKKFMWKAIYRQPLSEQISGSGWFIKNEEFTVDTGGDLLVITNAHVAKNAAEINILVPSLGQEPIPAEVKGLCSQRDIAILKVSDKKKLLALYKAKTGKTDVIRMSLGNSDEMKRGARVMAVGYPLGLKSVKASMGIVSGYQQFKSALYLQITAPINPGNSGGPLFNEAGQVVGINSAKIASASGMSFSIASVQLKVMLDVLYKTRQFIVPYLGYGFSVGTKLIQKYLAVPEQKDSDGMGGIYITHVRPNGLFQMAGAKAGDLLLKVDQAAIDRFGQTWMPTMKDNINILGLLARKKIGSELQLEVWRKGAKKIMKLTTKYDQTPPFKVPFIYEPLLNKPKFQIYAGVVFMELVENLIETMLESNVAELIKYMKADNRMNSAVIIAGVLPGSVADLDGSVKKGLIVQKINGKPIKDMADVCTQLDSGTDWFTVSTSKTFTALKVADIEEDDAEMQGKSQGMCKLKAAGKPGGASNSTATVTTTAPATERTWEQSSEDATALRQI